MHLYKLQNVFVHITNCICTNYKIYLYKLQNVFLQIARGGEGTLKVTKIIHILCVPGSKLLDYDITLLGYFIEMSFVKSQIVVLTT